MAYRTFVFGQVTPLTSQVFFASKLTRGVVNLKPLFPGHVLVVPKRRTSRFAELTPEEVSDLWISAQKIASAIESQYAVAAITFIMQDGKAAGQTIDHVHIHIIPRATGVLNDGDEIYKKLGEDRPPRTEQEMTAEALLLREKLKNVSLDVDKDFESSL